MTETHFFMTRADVLGLVSYLIDKHCACFVPEISFEPPPFPRYSSVNEVVSRVDKDQYHSRFFVLSSVWELHPLCALEVTTNDGAHYFVVSQKYGGPAFDLFLPKEAADGDSRFLIAGSISDYSYYIVDKAFLTDRSSYRAFDRPTPMIEAHKDVRRFLRTSGTQSVCSETGRAGPWIGSGALAEHRSGLWLRGGDWHYCPRPSLASRGTPRPLSDHPSRQ